MKDILVGEDTIDLVVDVNGCRVFAAVFRFCGFLHLFGACDCFCASAAGLLVFEKTSPPKARGG